MNEQGWCVEFWDCGAWNEMANTRRQYKQQARELAEALNRRTTHEERQGVYSGHRFRVRRVRDGALVSGGEG